MILVSNLLVLSPTYAQVESSSEELSVEEELDQVLGTLSTLRKTLKKNRQKRPVANKIKRITREIIKAVNSIPPEKCLEKLTDTMNEFYELVSDLGSGISCGPEILPPFFPEGEIENEDDLGINCIPPPEFEDDIAFQIGGPFGGSFADVHPVYEQCRDLFQIDEDLNNISDACE